jgi:non-specific protein-tyrosine kinase
MSVSERSGYPLLTLAIHKLSRADRPGSGGQRSPRAERTVGAPSEAPGDLQQDLAILWDQRWLIAMVTALMLALAVALTYVQTPIYTATAKTLVKPTGIDIADVGAGGIDKLVSLPTEAELVRSTDVAVIAAAEMNGDTPPQDLLSHVSVDVPTGSQVLEIKYSDPAPARAQEGAQAFADAYLRYRGDQAIAAVAAQRAEYEAQIDEVRQQLRDLEDAVSTPDVQSQKEQLRSQITLLQLRIADLFGLNTDPGTIVLRPEVPASPSSPNRVLNVALGLFAGLFLGVGLAFLRTRMDRKLRGRVDLEEALGAPVLAIVPRVFDWRDRHEARLETVHEPYGPASEAYRALRPALLAAGAERSVKVITVISPSAGEGKTTTAANLAIVLSQADRRVALVSADMRKPRVHEFFSLLPEPGLAEVLNGSVPWQEATQTPATHDGLRVLTGGRSPEQPAELLQSLGMERFLTEIREAVDFVILDCPPVLVVADSLGLIPLSDGVLFVADARSTTREAVVQARHQLNQIDANVIGAVLNDLDPRGTRARAGYGYGYGYEYAAAADYAPARSSTNGRRSHRRRRAATP